MVSEEGFKLRLLEKQTQFNKIIAYATFIIALGVMHDIVFKSGRLIWNMKDLEVTLWFIFLVFGLAISVFLIKELFRTFEKV